jgi:hypothetical protein
LIKLGVLLDKHFRRVLVLLCQNKSIGSTKGQVLANSTSTTDIFQEAKANKIAEQEDAGHEDAKQEEDSQIHEINRPVISADGEEYDEKRESFRILYCEKRINI